MNITRVLSVGTAAVIGVAVVGTALSYRQARATAAQPTPWRRSSTSAVPRQGLPASARTPRAASTST